MTTTASSPSIRLYFQKKFKLHLKVFLFILSLLFFSQYYSSYIKVRSFHEDEVTFIERGKFLDYYLAGNFSRREWQSYESYDVPKFAELLYGLMLRVRSGKTVQQHLIDSDFMSPTDIYAGQWRIEYGRSFDKSIQELPEDVQKKVVPIVEARVSSVFFTVLSLGLICLIGWKVKNWNYGMIAMFVIHTSSLFQRTMSTAMGDSPLLFFSLLLLSIFIFKINDILKGSKNGFLCVYMLGIIGGLAVSTKLNGGIDLIFFTVSLSFLTFQKKMPLSLLLKYIAIFFSTAFFIFYVLNPFIWANPIYNPIFMIQHRARTFKLQQSSSFFPDSALLTIPSRFQTFYEFSLAPNGKYTTFSLDNPLVPINTIVFSFGLFLLLIINTSYKKTKLIFNTKFAKKSEYLIFCIWIFIWFFMTVLFIPLDWDRYWLPVIIPLILTQCLLLEFIISLAIYYLKRICLWKTSDVINI